MISATVLLACAVVAIAYASAEDGAATSGPHRHAALLLEDAVAATAGAGGAGMGGAAARPLSRFIRGVQQLAGWRKEKEALNRIEKRAEEKLHKDETTSREDDDPALDFDSAVYEARNATGGAMREVRDDDGEEVPEETLGAEAAALGFSSVSQWRQSLGAIKHAKVARAKPSRKVEHKTGGGVVGDVDAVVKWVDGVAASAFKARARIKEQQLFLALVTRNPHSAVRIGGGAAMRLPFFAGAERQHGGGDDTRMYALVPVKNTYP